MCGIQTLVQKGWRMRDGGGLRWDAAIGTYTPDSETRESDPGTDESTHHLTPCHRRPRMFIVPNMNVIIQSYPGWKLQVDKERAFSAFGVLLLDLKGTIYWIDSKVKLFSDLYIVGMQVQKFTRNGFICIPLES